MKRFQVWELSPHGDKLRCEGVMFRDGSTAVQKFSANRNTFLYGSYRTFMHEYAESDPLDVRWLD